jgi:hypothetical protein
MAPFGGKADIEWQTLRLAANLAKLPELLHWKDDRR